MIITMTELGSVPINFEYLPLIYTIALIKLIPHLEVQGT